MKKANLIGWFFIVPLVLDRVTKYAVLLFQVDAYHVNRFLTLDLVFNRGISWSMFNAADDVTYCVLTSALVIVTIGLAWYTYQRLRMRFSVYGELLILSGAISNIIDRFFYPGVVDFIVVHVGSYAWPTFNIADACIVMGVGIVLLTSYYEKD